MTQYSGKIIRKTPVVPTQQAASGVWTTADAAVAVRNNTWPVAGVPDPISRSVRFRSSASAYLNRTQGTPTDEKKFTQSVWLKRGTLGVYQAVIGGRDNSTGQTPLYFTSGDQIGWGESDGVSTYYSATTTAVFRDPSAWYHIVTVYDSNNATAADRLIIYVNGVRQTITISGSGSSIPSGRAGYWNQSGTSILIGATNTVSDYFDGYLTEMNNIDGQALTPSSFGTTDVFTGAWIPMAYTGTYGANGFYLNFKDNTSTTTLGYDYSGNSNNWTANNISLTAGTTYDSMLDVPTLWVGYSATTDTSAVTRGNYAVWNSLRPSQMAGGSATISNGNLTVGDAGTSYGVAAQGTIAVSSGKWYWEVTASTVGGNYGACGIRLETLQGTDGAGYFYFSDGTKVTTVYGGSATSYGASYTSGDVIGVALDMDAGTLAFYKNGTSQGTAYTSLSGLFSACVGDGQNATAYVWNINFGQRPFTYTAPSGFKTLCTTNLPDPTIKLGAQYMAATLYTANQTARNITNGSNNTTATTFQPDFVWIKSRSATWSHALFDSVRGAGRWVRSNDTNAEPAQDLATLSSFNSDGFGLGANASGTAVNFATGDTYVAWQWKAAGSTVSNTNGTITSTVNAGTTQGFSVVTYTGNGTNGATVGHGLGVTPSMVIVKSRSATTSWFVAHTSLTTNFNLLLQTSDMAYGTSGFGSGVVGNLSSTVFTCVAGVSAPSNVANINTNGATYVAYCFAAVAGYSAFGSYTGNGSTDGPFIYCGFRPRWLMIKRTDATQNWAIIDTSRDTYNVSNKRLFPNLSDAEDTGIPNFVDVLSNGFKIRDSNVSENASGGTYIYAAFAENPFKYSNAR